MFVYGEYDDSPRAQLIGLLAIIIGIVGLIKNKKKFLTNLYYYPLDPFVFICYVIISKQLAW
ncbi:MAG: hypothetical protein WC349_00940 [Patescibacteria group bacterium]|jgi:hypothetical protein